MHIKQFELRNIRGIEKLRVKFDKPAGWHVFIGDNGSGKSTLLRSLSLMLIGPSEINALRQPFSGWIRAGSEESEIGGSLIFHDEDRRTGQGRQGSADISANLKIERENGRIAVTAARNAKAHNYVWGKGAGWFSAAFGPFRRFTGGSKDWQKLFYSNPKAAAHLSVFGEDVALTESIEWLQNLYIKSLENDEDARYQLASFKQFINQSDLLPHKTLIEEVNSEGVFLTDGAGRKIPLVEMSDGFRSVLSLTFELLRQMVLNFGAQRVFRKLYAGGEATVDIHGVILIDEVDVHLHPSWQARIGDWFLDHFPNIQFIVTTHSPIICRAAERGSVWKLSAPGSEEPSQRVQGVALQRLIYGNVLDAYGTELFGENTTSSDHATEMLEELARLHRKSVRGMITEGERQRMFELRSMMPTETIADAET
jgi:energy-coupling factor transporter ATP-binding protein EcfA2